MFFRSLFYERNVLMHLARVQQLPPEVQAEIAKRVGNFIELAKPVSDDLLPRFGEAAREEKRRAVELGAKSDTDPLWAAPAISEAWCNAKLGLFTGERDKDHLCRRELHGEVGLRQHNPITSHSGEPLVSNRR